MDDCKPKKERKKRIERMSISPEFDGIVSSKRNAHKLDVTFIK